MNAKAPKQTFYVSFVYSAEEDAFKEDGDAVPGLLLVTRRRAPPPLMRDAEAAVALVVRSNQLWSRFFFQLLVVRCYVFLSDISVQACKCRWAG